MTRPQIIGRLLQSGHITEEEAVVLLGGKTEIVIRHEHEYTPVYPTVPYQPVQPWPYQPTTPDYVPSPYFVTCGLRTASGYMPGAYRPSDTFGS